MNSVRVNALFLLYCVEYAAAEFELLKKKLPNNELYEVHEQQD